MRWSSPLLTILFLIIVVTIDLPKLSTSSHDRFFWILTVRETAFASGALVLTGSLWPRGSPIGRWLILAGRTFVGCAMVFYAVQHFLHPLNVPGVPLEKMIPAWVPLPEFLSSLIGAVLFLGGIGILVEYSASMVAAITGTVLVLLTALFYVPISVVEWNTPLALEGINYIGDTLLFAATILLSGFGSEHPLSVPDEVSN